MFAWSARARAAAIHLLLGTAVAALTAALVFGLWYPYPYREISGGKDLFMLVMAVDVVLGPLTTFLVFDIRKPRAVLVRDLAIVAALQLGGLAYGMWTVAVARPVHLVFEIDRFRVVHAVDVPEHLLDKTPAGIQAKPWTGPDVLASHRPKARDVIAVAALELEGTPLASRPDLWRAYEAARSEVLRVAKPVADLRARYPQQIALIDATLAETGRSSATTLYVPMMGRKSFWTVLVDSQSAAVVGFVPIDSF
jgi:hypothetical protein